jgi:hypothetical protein
MATRIERAWAAGFFEGEGSVRINAFTGQNMGTLLVDLPNTDESAVRFFGDRWGGTVRFTPMEPPRRGYWRWRCASRQAAAFLHDVLPFMRTEKYRERARLGLAYQAQKRAGGRVPPEYRVAQQDFYERMKALNIRGC